MGRIIAIANQKGLVENAIIKNRLERRLYHH